MEERYRIGRKVMLNWEIVRELGAGASGKVFEIQKNSYGITTKSALKVIKIPASHDELVQIRSTGMSEEAVFRYFRECMEDTVQEIQTMAGLKSHPGIVSYEDHIVIPHDREIGWDILIRMELLTPLLKYQEQYPMNETDVLRMGRELGSALVFCHQKGMIHRDIKPENIFVSSLGHFKLGDFGIARTLAKTASGLSVKGTESYMAPEVYKGEPYGYSVDIYSLGLVLYRFMNKNRLPLMPAAPQPITYRGHQEAIARRMQGEGFPPPCDADEEFGKVILRACAYLPGSRYESAEEFLSEINLIEYSEENGTIEIRRQQYPVEMDGTMDETDPNMTVRMKRDPNPGNMNDDTVIGETDPNATVRMRRPVDTDNNQQNEIVDDMDPDKTVRIRRSVDPSRGQYGTDVRQTNQMYSEGNGWQTNQMYSEGSRWQTNQMYSQGSGRQTDRMNPEGNRRQPDRMYSDSSRPQPNRMYPGDNGQQLKRFDQQNESGNTSGSKKRSGWIIAIAVVITLIVIADVCAIRYIRRDKKTSDTVASQMSAAASSESETSDIAEQEEEEVQSTDNKKSDDEADPVDDEADNDTDQEPESQEEVEEEELTEAVLLKDSDIPSVSSIKVIPVASATATSTISQTNTDNGPMRLFDDREDTSWQEGVSGYGVGESVSCQFNSTHEVKYIAFKLGNWRSEKYFKANAVPKTMTISIGDFVSQVTFSGKQKVEWVEIPDGVSAGGMSFIIDDIYKGTSWDDTCITDITIYGN
ncbi:MAG: protein kinase [Lachnospiraceae bacterium]|nr:protein kinase [Lachnospiraceae bacterium]